MSYDFIKIIQDAVKIYNENPTHIAIKEEIIGVVGEAVEKMEEKEILAFDEWFFSSQKDKILTEKELKVVGMIRVFLEEN